MEAKMPKRMFYKLDKQNRLTLPVSICDIFNFKSHVYFRINKEGNVCIYESHRVGTCSIPRRFERTKSGCVRIIVPNDLLGSKSFKAEGDFFILNMKRYIELYPFGKPNGS